LSKQTAKNVPVVTEPAQEESKPGSKTEEQFKLIPDFNIDKKTKGLAKKFGVDLEPIEQIGTRINNYAVSVEKRFEFIANTLEQMQPLIELSQQVKQKQMQPQQAQPQAPAPSGLGGITDLLPLVASMLKGGGGDDEFKKLAMDSMREDIAFTRAMKSAIISKITGEATTTIAKAAAGV